ncbi:hypothetical protein [Bacteroides sp.]|uniref:hypothetical protein n=1 Tax=Bacteroides sp. TaxID=29523 RepID=UPI0026100BE7|nr:hypothetical protein [Bacteroides sp.]MDD3040355.1 hypothetical protein [Bacteroides sp.]
MSNKDMKRFILLTEQGSNEQKVYWIKDINHIDDDDDGSKVYFKGSISNGYYKESPREIYRMMEPKSGCTLGDILAIVLIVILIVATCS